MLTRFPAVSPVTGTIRSSATTPCKLYFRRIFCSATLSILLLCFTLSLSGLVHAQESSVSSETAREATYWFSQDLVDAEGYIRVKREDVTPPFKEIDRRANLTLQTFLKDYARVGKPVVITDGTKDWDVAKARLWTARTLHEAYPHDVHNRWPNIGKRLRECVEWPRA